MNKTLFAFLLVLAAISINSCSSSSKMSIIGSWVDKEKIQATENNGVYIVVVTHNMEARSLLENDLAAAAAATNAGHAVARLPARPPAHQPLRRPVALRMPLALEGSPSAAVGRPPAAGGAGAAGGLQQLAAHRGCRGCAARSVGIRAGPSCRSC